MRYRYVPTILQEFGICSNMPTVFSVGEGNQVNVTSITSREFNQNVSKAKRAAAEGPVFITDRGHTAHVLLTIEEYQKITDKGKSIVELLAMPDAADIDFEAPRIESELYRPADLS